LTVAFARRGSKYANRTAGDIAAICTALSKFRETPDLRILTAARIAGWTLAVIIVVLSVVPPGLRPETGAPRYLEHFAIFAATGFAFGQGYEHRNGWLAIFFVLFSGGVEIMQRFVPGRHARFSDFIIDASAMVLGLVAASVIDRLRAVP